MYIALVSASADPQITPALVRQMAESLQVQVYRDFGPAWQSAGMPIQVFDKIDEVPADEQASPLVIFDTPDQSGALGWHSVDPRGRAYGRAFWNVIRENGGALHNGSHSLSVTLSHEVLEMIGDPYTSWWADMPDGKQECLEVCDRCQADSYDIDGISVSNFLTPRAFRNGDGPYDFMRLLRSPWEIRPGGYAIRRDGARIFNVWSSAVPEWQRQLKMMPASRTARRHHEIEDADPTIITTKS